MTKHMTPPLDENTRRYYLDVMGVQCWESRDPQSLTDDSVDDVGIEATVESNTEVADTGWQHLDEAVRQCDKCPLHEERKQALTGRGNLSAELMFVVLSPNARDDDNGVICSEAVNDLLSKMLAAIDINIDDVYISSLLKCAVPANHTVLPEEIRSCHDYLKRQIQLIRPKLLVVLGEIAVRCLLQKDLGIDDFRALNPDQSDQGQLGQIESTPLFVSYSPEELMQQAEDKRKAWSDLQQLQKIINNLRQ